MLLARYGAHVIMACRSPDRAQQAHDDIKNQVPSASLEIMQVDLGDWDSVRNFSEEIRRRHTHIDVLINNAGLVKSVYEKSKYGVEFTLTVNYLGTFLLTQLLLDFMENAPEPNGLPRVVMVASNAHSFAGKLDMDQLEIKEDKIGKELSITDTMTQYGRTKLCLLLYFQTLNKELREKKSRVLVYACDPGWVQTELNRAGDEKFYIGLVKAFEGMVAKKPIEGAIPSVYCACDTQLGDEASSGQYFDGIKKYAPWKSYARNEETGKLLWEWSEKILKDWLVKE